MKSKLDISKVLIIDLEAACWEGKPPPGNRKEIIEIGNAVLHLETGEIERGPEILVRPKYSGISDFCTKLTSITPAMVAKDGVSFPDGIRKLLDAYPDIRQVPWGSYGGYDFYKIIEECRTHEVFYPMSPFHINVKRLTAMLLGWRTECGMRVAMQKLGLDMMGTHHRGADDAVNIARIWYEICKKARR